MAWKTTAECCSVCSVEVLEFYVLKFGSKKMVASLVNPPF
jgi:hypothetical protein